MQWSRDILLPGRDGLTHIPHLTMKTAAIQRIEDSDHKSHSSLDPGPLISTQPSMLAATSLLPGVD